MNADAMAFLVLITFAVGMTIAFNAYFDYRRTKKTKQPERSLLLLPWQVLGSVIAPTRRWLRDLFFQTDIRDPAYLAELRVLIREEMQATLAPVKVVRKRTPKPTPVQPAIPLNKATQPAKPTRRKANELNAGTAEERQVRQAKRSRP